MKKLLLTMACAAVFGFAQAAEITETITVDNFSIEKVTSYTDVTYTSTVTGITYSGNMAKANEGNGSGMQFRTSSGKEAGFVATANPNNYKIVSVKVTPSTTASTTNQWDVYGNMSAYANFKDLYGTENQGTLIGSGTSEATVTATEDLIFFGFRANKNAIYINQIEIVYSDEAATPDTRKDAGLSFPEEKYTVVMGEAFTAPVLTKETTAAVSYSSDKETVATVDAATGVVTVVGVGTARITATAEANDEYKAGEASYLLTVEKAPVANAIYSGLIENADDWTIDNGTLPEGLTYIWSWDKSYKYLKASAYKGGNFASSATVTSPEIDLTGVTNAALSFNQVGNFFKGNMQTDVKVLVSVDGANFTELTVAPWPEADGWKPWVESSADLKAYDGKKIKVQFLYTSSTERAGTWEIKEFVVTGDKSQGVADVEVVEDAPAVYYNLQGVRVENPENGLYIKVQGKKSSKVYIK